MMSLRPSPAEAARELLRRRQARRQLEHFTTYTYPRYQVEPVHRLVAATLDRIVAGQIDRLMISAPPQHGKSELASVRLPAFWLGRRPDDPVILASYGASLAESKSRQAREIVESADYAAIFAGTTTRADSRAVNQWQLARSRGGMLAVGVGGPITGHGARLGIIDDPFENWEQAHSQTIRDKVWDWYRTTFRTRIWEGGAIILIMTRWHEDDLAGRLLAANKGEWTVLRLPAVAETQEVRDRKARKMNLPIGEADPLEREPGEPLSPQRYSAEELARLQADVGSLGWEAEYQGSPTLPEGNRFKRAWFPIVEASPARARRVRYWDKAATADGGAYTAGVLMAWDGELFYVDDVVRGQWSSGERNTVMKQAADMDAQAYQNTVHVWVEQEPGSGGKESAEATIHQLAGFPVFAEPVTGSKDVRLEPFAAQCEAGNVRLVRGSWNADYVEELCAVPSGKYRDQSDASGGAFNKLSLGQQGSRTRRTA